MARSRLWVRLRGTQDPSLQGHEGGHAQPRTKPDFPSSRSEVLGARWASGCRTDVPAPRRCFQRARFSLRAFRFCWKRVRTALRHGHRFHEASLTRPLPCDLSLRQKVGRLVPFRLFLHAHMWFCLNVPVFAAHSGRFWHSEEYLAITLSAERRVCFNSRMHERKKFESNLLAAESPRECRRLVWGNSMDFCSGAVHPLMCSGPPPPPGHDMKASECWTRPALSELIYPIWGRPQQTGNSGRACGRACVWNMRTPSGVWCSKE